MFQEIFEFIRDSVLPENHNCKLHDLPQADQGSSGTGEQATNGATQPSEASDPAKKPAQGRELPVSN